MAATCSPFAGPLPEYGDVAKGLKSSEGEIETEAAAKAKSRGGRPATLEVPVDRTRDVDAADRREP